MKIVIDTNIVFSAVINSEGKIGDVLLNSEDKFEFCSVEHLKTEIEKHKERLCDITGFDEEKVDEIIERIFLDIEFVSEESIPFEVWYKSLRLVRDVDIHDISFVALTEFLDVNLWTGDKKLIKGLSEKGYNKCVTTDYLYVYKNIDESSNS